MILLIGGTSETPPLAAGLAAAGYAVLVSTATDVPLAIEEHPRIRRRTGRLDEEGLVALAGEEGVRAIVDAAHPYAAAAHAAAYSFAAAGLSAHIANGLVALDADILARCLIQDDRRAEALADDDPAGTGP